MKRRIKYTDEPIEAEVIEDFLPPPEKLSRREKNVKVTTRKITRKILDYDVSRYKRTFRY
jgi:hypothetical protein